MANEGKQKKKSGRDNPEKEQYESSSKKKKGDF